MGSKPIRGTINFSLTFRKESIVKGRYKPKDEQIVGNEIGFSNYKQAEKELKFEQEFGGHKDLVVVEYDCRVYVCYGGDHKLAYKTFLSPAEIRALEEDE